MGSQPSPRGIAAIDLDGTLLRNDGSVSERTRKCLRQAAQAGILPIIVTARPPRIARIYCELLGLEGYAVCCNGAIVYDPREDAVISAEVLAQDVAAALIGELQTALPGLLFGWERGVAYGCEEGFVLAEQFVGETVSLHPPDGLSKLLVHHPQLDIEDVLAATSRVLKGDGVATISGSAAVEISPPDIDKAAGVAQLAAVLDLDACDVVAFGDMPNDIAMLRWAGLGVAVENAHASVLEAADEITASNERDGVARVLERLIGSPPT